MLIANLQNLQQENRMLSTIKFTQTVVKEVKMVQPLYLKLKSLNENFVLFRSIYSCNRRH